MVRFLLAFLFSLNASAALYNPQGTAPLSLLTASSGTKTPAATSQYHALTGNSVPLAANSTYELFGSAFYTQVGGTAAYSACLAGFFGANGADSVSSPTALNATSGLTVNSVYQNDGNLLTSVNFNVGSLVGGILTLPTVIVTTGASPVTVYVVTYANMTTASFARVSASINARKIY